MVQVMRTNEEVYGEGVKITPIPKKICDERIMLLNNRLEKLMSSGYMSGDSAKINKAIKDLNFWKRFRDGEGELDVRKKRD